MKGGSEGCARLFRFNTLIHMVKIKPFCGIRPPKQYASEVASRPYDVLNSAEAKAEEKAVEAPAETPAETESNDSDAQ